LFLFVAPRSDSQQANLPGSGPGSYRALATHNASRKPVSYDFHCECAVPALPPALSVCNLSAIHTFEVVVRFLSGPASPASSQLLPLSPHQFKYYDEGRILLISRNWAHKVGLLLARRHTMMTKSKSRSGSRTLIFKDREGGPAPREKMEQGGSLKRFMNPQSIDVTRQSGRRSPLPLSVRSKARPHEK
jgi:hypothetical protein